MTTTSGLLKAITMLAVAGCFPTYALGATSILGTWQGESICTSSKRPACKNEVVVYRFEAVAGKRGAVLFLADKIVNRQRDPMGKLDCEYDEAKHMLSCEFKRGQTHGLWNYTITGDAMDGTLLLLPDRELVRRVKAKRVSEQDVPAAPARAMYDGA